MSQSRLARQQPSREPNWLQSERVRIDFAAYGIGNLLTARRELLRAAISSAIGANECKHGTRPVGRWAELLENVDGGDPDVRADTGNGSL